MPSQIDGKSISGILRRLFTGKPFFCSNKASVRKDAIKEKTMSQQHMKARKRARRKQYIERVKARIAEKIAAKKK